MCPTGTVHEADNLNGAKLGLNSLTISRTKNTLNVTNGDWMVQMEYFVVSLQSLKYQIHRLATQPASRSE